MRKKVFPSYWALLAMLLLSINAAHSQTALIMHKTSEAAESAMLDNIQRITFSDNDLVISTRSDGSIAIYDLDDIAKLSFGNVIPGNVSSPQAQKQFDVFVYATPDGEIVVESPAAIKSLTLMGVDGQVLVRSVETLRATSLQTTLNVSSLPAGVYLLRVETEQGTAGKKIIKK